MDPAYQKIIEYLQNYDALDVVATSVMVGASVLVYAVGHYLIKGCNRIRQKQSQLENQVGAGGK